MATKSEVTLEKLRQLCNAALSNEISDEEFFKKSMEFFLPKSRVKKPKVKKIRRGIGSY